MKREHTISGRLLAAIVGVVGATFALDLATPRGVADGIPYLIPVLLAARLPRRGAVWMTAVASTLLTVLGFFLSPSGAPLEIALANRGLVLLAIWLAVAFSLQGRRTEEREEQLFRLSNDLLCIADFGGYFKRLNPAWEKTLGFSRNELMDRPYVEFVHPDDRAATIAEARKLTTGVETVRFENRFLCKDGSYCWLSWNTTPLLDQRVLYAVAHDITEVKRLQQAQLNAKEEEFRRKYEAEYRNLVENAVYGIYRVTVDGRFMYVNPALVSLLGYDSKEELLAKNLGTDVYRDPEERGRIVEEVMRTGGVGDVEVEWRRKDEKLIRVRITGHSVRNEQGELQGFEAMVENVSEQRLLEQQYRQAQKMEAVGRLAGGIAHDFNNLLSVIIGYSELLSERAESSERQKQAEEIRKAGHRAASLTRQLLAFSRRQVLEPKVLDLKGITSDMGRMLQRLIGEDIKLVITSEAALGQVRADPGQIEQVILNLAVNARDAMPTGGELKIETANVVLDEAYARVHVPVVPGRYVMLTVSDTGVGMDAETQARVFEPFFTTKEEGTGLGLATVYGVVKQSGGYIWVYSEPEKGTTFKVHFPRVDQPAEVTRLDTSTGEPQGGSETILLVEDSEALRALAREFLERGGYRVLDAGEGSEAIQLAGQCENPIHLLLTDVVMPGMSGHELAAQMKGRHPETKVLYMSGYTDDAMVRHGVLEERVAFLPKPFTRETLARKVRQVLDSEAKPGDRAPRDQSRILA